MEVELRAGVLLSPPFPFSWASPLISQIYLIYFIDFLRLSEILQCLHFWLLLLSSLLGWYVSCQLRND